MPMSDEPYIAELIVFHAGEAVKYGDPITIPASVPIEIVIAKAVRWATELHKGIGTKAMLVVNRESIGVFMQAFNEKPAQRS
jgi:hypothetical protein